MSEQAERELFRWSKSVLQALGDIEALGEFRIESTHKPVRFEISSGEEGLRLSARNPEANNNRGEMVCYFNIPAWLLRDAEWSNRGESEA